MRSQETSISHSTHKIKNALTVFVLTASLFFLFYNLGASALWDDEATTALYAQSVWRTGDSYALLDHNLIAYQDGKELRGLYNRYMPPLAFYIAAPFTGSFPGSAFAARFPFAVCGLLTIGIILLWLWRSWASTQTWILMSIGIVGNVSFMLFSRQCRYYALAILFTTFLAYLYHFRDNRLRTSLLISVVSILLLASHYLCYLAAYICLVIDYILWGRKSRPLTRFQITVIFISQLLLGGIFLYVLNPWRLNVEGGGFEFEPSVLIPKILKTFLDFNYAEMGVGILILLAPLLYLFTKNTLLLRCFVAIVSYLLVVGTFSPPLMDIGTTLRYAAALIPLFIVTAVLVIQVLTKQAQWLAVPLAVLAFCSNLLHLNPFISIQDTAFSKNDNRMRLTVVEYVKELMDPPSSSYRNVAQWINQNLPAQTSVWVVPDYAAYPLMYHAPKAIYAWQLKEKTEIYKDLPDIHFINQKPPDYIIAFGPFKSSAQIAISELQTLGHIYLPVKQFDQYWYDLSRPEIFWHSFREIKDFSKTSEAITIFKRI